MISRELFPLPAPPALPAIESGNVSRQVCGRLRARHQRRQWEREVVHSLNSLHGFDSYGGELGTSLAQTEALTHVRTAVEAAGPPPCDAAAAYLELCGHAPGYFADPATCVPFQKDLVSLPTEGATFDPGEVLCGDALDKWNGWRDQLLRQDVVCADCVKPYSDPSLIRNRMAYAEFILRLVDTGLIRLGERTAPTLGVFFVRKGAKQRMIMDTRLVNSRFSAPSHTELPTSGSWTSLRTPPDGGLHLSQIDIDNCFHRMQVPKGIEEHFVLPDVRRSALLELRPDLELPSESERFSPLLLVLPMGWSWSLHFCQLAVEQIVLQAGFFGEDLVHDRRQVPPLTGRGAVAVYVDGVAVVHSDRHEARSRPREVGLLGPHLQIGRFR